MRALGRLSATDASFLVLEGPDRPMAIGCLAVLEGPAPAHADLVAHVDRRLYRAPRARQRVVVPRVRRPYWVDDPAFDAGAHVRRAVLPPPGSDAALLALTQELHARPLDRARPLWEVVAVDGLAGGRWALVIRAHHAFADGIATVGLAGVLFDLASRGEEDDPPPAASEDVVAPRRAGRIRAALRAAAAVGPRDAAAGALALARILARPAPRSPLGGPPRAGLRVCCRGVDVAALRSVAREHGGTVNDVVLAVVAGALRGFLQERGASPRRDLQALVPVSLRRARHHPLGNRVTLLRVALPVGEPDPLARLAAARAAMRAVKGSAQWAGVELVRAAQSVAPPGLRAPLARLQFTPWYFSLIVTSVPGPPVPVAVLGRAVTDVFPLAFLPPRHALALAAVSYAGRLEIGMLADAGALPDVERLGTALEASLGELSTRGRTSRPRTSSPASTAG